MERNTYKSTQPGKKRRGLFTYLEKLLPFQSLFAEGLPVRYIPFILFLLVLGLVYVGNSHYHERMIRQVNALEQEVGALRVDFTALKASYMLDSKQSAVSARVAALGLYESNKPPYKVKRLP